MKELTIEEKAERYDKAIEIARKLNNGEGVPVPHNWTAYEIMFPELKESEDEKIRKAIIHLVRKSNEQGGYTLHKDESEKMLAYLEKQGEQKEPYDTCNSSMMDNKKSPYSEKRDFGYFEEKPAEKQGEQKSADKVEPKFKVGDWIACDGLNTALIVNIDGDKYEVEVIDGTKGFPHIVYVDNNFHLWTIQDAKDGDILFIGIDGSTCIFKKVEGNLLYSYITFDGKSFVEDSNYHYETFDNVHPATKEQNDFLFSKMHEARYEWNAYEKELNKIEPKFKVGVWIANGNFVLHITNMDYEFYQFEDSYEAICIIDEKYHLWTIQDANDGDVLCTYECDEPKIVFILKGTPKKHYALSYHCYYNIMYPHFGSDSEKGCLAPNDEDVKPATKEQRDLLFAKMKEAGYEWDAEKKELKKVEQKPTWSEDDEKMIEAALQFAHEYGRHGLWSWLKGLKDRFI